MKSEPRLINADPYGAGWLARLDANRVDRAKLIPQLTGIAGAAAFLRRTLDPEWSMLVF